MLKRLVSTIFLVFIALTSSLLFLMALLLRIVSYPFDRRLRLLHLFTCFWASIYTWVMPAWRIRIEGRENVRKDTAYMIISNHQSQMDILVAFRLFFHYKWVSKSEMFRVPFVGWNMTLNRYVKLKRGDKESIEQMLRECAIHLRQGSSIFMFPEGTRSSDGQVKNFKLGAFEMALEEKVPILPIVISGTNKALPKYSMNFHGVQKMYIKIYEEIPYSAFENLSAADTAQMVRQFTIEKLKIMNEYTMGN